MANLIKKINVNGVIHSIYDERVPDNAQFTDTTYGVEKGISLSEGKFGHSNSISAQGTQGLYKISWDAQGHITGSTKVTQKDISDLGISITDTNTTYKLTIGSTTRGDSTNGVDLGTLTSKPAASSGSDLSLVTTGEKATWNAKTSNTGTVTSVSGTDGLTGGGTTDATLKANLKSYTKNTNVIGGKLYAVQLDSNGQLAVNVPWTDTDNDSKVTSVDNHYKTSGFTSQTTSDLYKLTIDAAGHITGATAVKNSDIAKYISGSIDDISDLQDLVGKIKAELEDPNNAYNFDTILDTMNAVLNSSANAVTGVTEAAYGEEPSLSVDANGVLSFNPGTITGGIASSTKSFVTAPAS